MTDWWLLTPLLSALIGWGIARLMVSIIFYPSKPAKMMGFTFHGMVWRRQKDISGQLARFAGKELFSFKEIEQKILSIGNFEKIKPEVEAHIEHFLAVKLKEKMPMVGMFVGERTLGQLKEIFMEELETLFPVIMKSYVAGVEGDFDVEQMIIKKLASIPDDRMSAYITRMAIKQLKILPIIGALMGFIIGSIQICIILFLNR